MVRDINGLGNYANNKTVAEQDRNKTATQPRTDAADTEPASSSAEVQLSSSAQSLQALASKVNDLPEVNVEKALQIKAALESGQYQIDDLVLADKILNSETLLNND